MNNYVGLSFSAENIYYAHFIKNEENYTLDHLGEIVYPFQYNENIFLNDNNIIQLADVINGEFKSRQLENITISISIESNLTKLKRVLIPEGLSKEEEKEQINWDLQQSILESIKDYVYLVTPNFIISNSYKDILVIAIKKNIVDFYQRLVKYAEINLINLSINQLSAEVCLEKTSGNINGLNILFKMTETLIETTYIWNGNYYSSSYDRLLSKQQKRKFEDIIIEKLSSKIKYIENIFEQIEHKPISVNRIYLYGSGMNDKLIKLIHKNVSITVEILDPTSNIPISPNMQKNLSSIGNITNYVECIGVALDI
jgi:Tfp pilus assembly PilM family ATPase